MKDYQLIFHDGQFLDDSGGTGDPTNPSFIEIAKYAGGGAGIGLGSITGRIYIQITEAYNNLTSARFRLAFANADTDAADTLRTQEGAEFFDNTIARADGIDEVGYVVANLVIPSHPRILEATHIRLHVDLAGTAPTTGAFFAGYSLESEGFRAQRPGLQLRGAYGPWQSQYTAGYNPNTPARSA